ncbi:MAG: hypothetical protein M1840_003267, partial [Geoglossum simile]
CVYEICKSTGNAGLFVEILEGEITQFNRTDYEVKARGGSSLSPTEVDYTTGTLGGYVKLAGVNGSRVFAVSCHHVIMPNRYDNQYFFHYFASRIPNPSVLDFQLISPDQGHDIRISQPSTSAHGKYMREQHLSQESIKQDIRQLEEEIESKPRTTKRLERAKDTLHRVQNDFQTALEFDRHCGTVFATSGYTSSTRIGCALDWALVDVQSTRRGGNEVHTLALLLSDTLLTGWQVPQLYNKPQRYDYLVEENVVDSVAALSLDDRVAKAGYMSNVTYGRVSHIKHDCKLPGKSSNTSEYVVVGQEGRPFAFRGDSGAFVLNSSGDLAGLLIAGQEELGTSYVTPIEEVMRDMAEVTGHEVTLP